MKFFKCLLPLFLLLIAVSQASAQNQAVWTAKNFKFHTGEVMPELRIAYTTVGKPSGQPVLILHGTGGNAGSMLGAAFAGKLFGSGQPLDAAKYFIIIPDGIGHGQSSKPSDGLRAKFPAYDYDDMVVAQYRLVTEGLGVHHLRLVMGNSMGGMHTWLWGTEHPGFVDALVPMASQPAAMSGRNWIMRRMITDAVRKDPAWDNGNYTIQPKAFKTAAVFYGLAMSGGNIALQQAAPTTALANQMLDQRLAAAAGDNSDANDTLYQWDASRDYDPSKDLEKITAAVLAINSVDDERNPPETGVMERELKRIKGSSLYLIPAGPDTRGHGTTGTATFYAAQLAAFLQGLPVKQK